MSSKKFKARWVYKAILWKLMSAVTGALVVLYLTGEYHTSWAYLALYVPVTLVLFVTHEFSWQLAKIRRRCPECDGTGVASTFAGTCQRCEGTGDRRTDAV